MSVEHQPKGPETSAENTAELESLAQERLEQLRNTPEQDESPDKRVEAARDAIKHHTEVPEPTSEAKAPASFVAKVSHVVNYSQTMQSLQRKLSPVSRNFSKVIHAPIVESASETLEKTVFRPSITNGALWTAAIVGLFFFVVARRYGFRLSGSELIFSFIVGGVLGGAIEGLWHVLARKR